MQNNRICDSFIVCKSCDALVKKCELKRYQSVACPRCGAYLCCGRIHSFEVLFSLIVTDLVLFLFSNIFPFISFHLRGREQITFLSSGALELCRQNFSELGILVLLTAIIFPLIEILGLFYIILSLRLNIRFYKTEEIFRFVNYIGEWAMMEVFMLGLVVVYVKLIKLATMKLMPSFYFFSGFIISMTMTSIFIDRDKIWEKLEKMK